MDNEAPLFYFIAAITLMMIIAVLMRLAVN